LIHFYKRFLIIMTEEASLLDLTEDTLLVIIDFLLLDRKSLVTLENSCQQFRTLFRRYNVWTKSDLAERKSWMKQTSVKSSEVIIASNCTEKESQLNSNEYMEVLFMDICDQFIVLVRYNQLDIVCTCPTMNCGCLVDKSVDSFEMNSVPKRLEIWDSSFRIVRVVSSRNFGLNSSKSMTADQFTFWSSMKREYPLFCYNKQRKIFAWVGSQVQDIQADLYYIESNSSKSIKITGNTNECYRAYGVAMYQHKFAIAYEKKHTPIKFELLIRWYDLDSYSHCERLVSQSETSIGKYSFNNCSPLDLNEAFTVIMNEIHTWTDNDGVFKLTSVSNRQTTLSRNIKFYCNHSRIFMKMNEQSNLIALLDSSPELGAHSVVRLFPAKNLEEISCINLRKHEIEKSALTESSNRIFWFKNILVIISDDDVEDENDFVYARKMSMFNIDDCDGVSIKQRKELDFWPAFVEKQTSTDPKLPLLVPESGNGLFIEAVAVGDMGIVVAARYNADCEDYFEDPDEMSYLFYLSMIPIS